MDCLSAQSAWSAAEVERFLLISTDKAVDPNSVYGASKLIAEELALRQGEAEQVFLVDTETREYRAADREAVTLPEGMNVELNTARSELTSETAGGIRFFPDGGSTGGNVRLEANGRIYRVNVAWLTGEARLERAEG